MDEQTTVDERQVVKQVLDLLGDLDGEARVRVLKTVATFFDVQPGLLTVGMEHSVSSLGEGKKEGREQKFSGHQTMSPKEFMIEKDPHTDVDRVVCLAYYLAHYLDKPHFKTSDISKLNTEAAQRKLTNAAYAVNNATQSGYFVAAPRGDKQLSVLGERYVEALPDHETAKGILSQLRRKRSRIAKRQGQRAPQSED